MVHVLLLLALAYFGVGLLALLLLGVVSVAIRAGYLTGATMESVRDATAEPKPAEPAPPPDEPPGAVTI